MGPNFDLQYQIDPNPENIFMLFHSPLAGISFGLAYSPLNSAKLSCSSEAILMKQVGMSVQCTSHGFRTFNRKNL